MPPIRLMTVAPGHFHAALVQKRMHPEVHRRAYVYAPFDADLLAHLARLTVFNTRPADPTAWELDVRAGGDYLARFLREQPGNVVVLSGKNRPKIDLMAAAVANGLTVLADKPWIVDHADFPKLEAVLRDAQLREVLVWDMLTERHEVANRLQRELVRDPAVFGAWHAGTPVTPALDLTSVHSLKKDIAGRPLRRPWWWFDSDISGDAIADVGTHLADLALWLAVPDQAVDYARDIAVLAADRWPLVVAREQFAEVTGLPDFPPELATRAASGSLHYAGNNTVTFTLRGLHVRLTTRWEYEGVGGDTHESVARGTLATVAVRQKPGRLQEVFVASADHAGMLRALATKCEALQGEFPGVRVKDRGSEARLVIPSALRLTHEDHFNVVLDEFARYFQTPRGVRRWERPNALARYYITTKAVEMARQQRPF